MAPSKKGKEASKRVDYIIVVKEQNVYDLKMFLANMKTLKLDYEIVRGETIELMFIKVTISNDALQHFSQVYDIGNEELDEGMSIYTEPIYPMTYFKTPISNTLPKKNKEITDAERVAIVNLVLESIKFDEKEADFGISKLVKRKIVVCAYPLHDGNGRLDGENTRSLLLRYWANISCVFKEQPLDMIYRYFGQEIAFYFAWLEYFVWMLIIPALGGAIVFVAAMIYTLGDTYNKWYKACEKNDLAMCATCEDLPNCKFGNFNKFCELFLWTFVFDNYLTAAFAVLMSFWAIFFINLWRRKENKLKLRWNTNIEDFDTANRAVFEDSAKSKRRNTITGELEPYIPKINIFFRYTVTLSTCAILIGIIFLTVLVITAFKVIFARYCDASETKFLLYHSKILTMLLGSAIQVFCIKLFEKIYGPLSIELTKYENPRTQQAFDNSVLYKRYLLSFINNYTPLFYLAFMKGKLYTVPHEINFFRRDACMPANCVLALCIQMAFLMTLKDLLGNVCSLIFFQIRKLINYLLKIKEPPPTSMPQWEEEYCLFPTNRYLLTTEFTEMIIKYGFVTFFVAAFPLAPLCALANNLLEMRSDAYKLVMLYRRPIPLMKSGIGAWNGVLLSVTFLSTATNAFVIAFTSDIVPRQVYRSYNPSSDLSEFQVLMLTKYKTVKYGGYSKLKDVPDFCYFRGQYRFTNYFKRHELSLYYWRYLTYRLITVFVFEHVILVCNAILSYSIPKFPVSVAQHLDKARLEVREAKHKAFQSGVNKEGLEKQGNIKESIKLHME